MAYNVILPNKFINASSMAASITSRVIEIKNQDNVGIQLNWTGTPTGTFDFQVCQDYDANTGNAGTWISLPMSATIQATGAADQAYIDFNNLSAAYIRVVYTRVSGAGSLDGYIVAKGV